MSEWLCVFEYSKRMKSGPRGHLLLCVSFTGEKYGLMREQQMQSALLPSIQHRGLFYFFVGLLSQFFYLRRKDYISVRVSLQNHDSSSILSA